MEPIVPEGQNILVQVASAVLFLIFIAIFAFNAWCNWRLTKRIENGY